ncbi:aminoglycoside phosphotransferase family protein [Actinoplanes sp. NPDC051411]|uniref:phosphotransferase family protein n=1 Tax=Actinoplanes sp. NPDC051411 TaxID=3155522 RepID=UPI00343E71B3
MSRKADIDNAAINALLHRVFGASVPLSYQRTPDGVSTQVYRIWRGSEVFYLRIAEEADENLETEAELHRRLRSLGVKVADIVHVEPFNADIVRSTMITTEIPGVSAAEIADPARAASIVEQAGADLAVINQIPADGFGFVRRRNHRWPLQAEYPQYENFLVSYLPHPWPGPLAFLFNQADLTIIEDLIEHERTRLLTSAVLSHGDFDLTPIFCAGDRYTGLIDFGEIRGTEPLFDLGHFHLHDQESSPATLLPALLRGYSGIQTLPADHLEDIRRSAILLGLRQLCRWLGPPRHYPLDNPAVTHRARRIDELIAQH